MVVGDLATNVDIVVLGAGPGGYAAAIRAAQLGKEVVVVDPGQPGGVCLHAGCIPSKALLHATQQARRGAQLQKMGIHIGETRIDWGQMQAWKSGIVTNLASGVEKLFKANQVEQVTGRGWFLNEHEVRVEGEYGAKRYAFEQCIIATGAAPRGIPQLPFDGERVLTASQALALSELPASCVVIGADYIAVELATIWGRLIPSVSLVVPAGETLLGGFEPAGVRLVQSQLKKLGVKITESNEYVAATADVEKVFVSLGVLPRAADLHLDVVGLECGEHGELVVDEQMQTQNGDIYAVGDVTGSTLAVDALKQGKVAAEAIAGIPAAYVPQAQTRFVWSEPAIASTGLTQAQAEADGYTVKTTRFPLGASGRAQILDSVGGSWVVADADSGLLLGATVVGPNAPELIGIAALAVEMGATVTDLAETLQTHPSLAETVSEAAEAALEAAIHIFQR